MLIQCRLTYQSDRTPLVIMDSSLGNGQLITTNKLRSLAKQLTAIANEADRCQHLAYQECERSY